ncbi:MAG: TonB-dependent receptor [Prevotellaceae bacterium]|jgi:TonB-linked SusC/RagA family outer membrane protein|nr:TonB-dependent receptor [Prevotellaceae bacterium]
MNKIKKLKKWSTVTVCILLYVCFPNVDLNAQNINIKGKVIDTEGNILPGTVVRLQGTTVGVSTNDDGDYVMNNVPTGSILEFIIVGYVTQEIKVLGDKTVINAILNEISESLEEVTVVAFGTQSKESVVASITTINPAELKIPSSNLTTALAGNMAGIIAYQRSGEPGLDNADFFVRGITTFGANTNPLILIDNIELDATDLARLQPDDIASFSIMKDATATALYGARGANGVIFVTTKRGEEGPAKIFLRLENSFSMPARNIELADPITYMKLHNEAVLTRDPLGELPYSKDKIENTLKPGSSPYIYPANDWYKMLFKDYTVNRRANLSVSGGNSVAHYYVSGAFTQDNGILKIDKRNSFNNNINLKNYNLRANVDVNVTKKTVLSVRLTGNFDDYNGPPGSGADVYRSVVRSNPVLFPAYYPVDEDFKYVNHIMFGNVPGIYTNPYANTVRGYQDKSRSQMLAQLELKQNLDFITKGLSVQAMMNISRLAEFNVNRSYKPYWYHLLDNYDSFTGEYHLERLNEDGTDYLEYNEGEKKITSTMYTETRLNYANTFGKHTASALLVFITRQGINANPGSLQLSLPSRNAGLSGRTTYSFDSRYFVEFNFGYNGSERFASNHRWGFFPSVGAGWLISNEKFWENIKPVVSNLKLRYSYGLVGNDRIGSSSDRFFYLSQVNMNDSSRGIKFGENVDKGGDGIRVDRYASNSITWETSTKQNYALELGLWNKVNIIAEYFTEYRSNILMTRAAIPSTMGLQAPVKANVGKAAAHGTDVQVDYQQSWSKDFWTAVRGNFTWSTSRFEVYEEPEYDEYWRSRIGRSLTQNYGYIAERLFMDDAEARNSPPQMFGGEYGGGDIKYTDVNRDGQITSADIVPIGNPTSPEIIYGFGLSAGYKGLDISVFFQGLANESFWISTVDNSGANTISTAPFQNQTQLIKAYADSHWSEDHQDMHALWPRLSPTLNPNNTQTSTWFMRDGSFLRLKQAEIGYTVPGKWQKKLHINQLRFYVSGTNLLLFSKFKLWDVEMAGQGLGYPVQRVFNIGLNFTFN